MYKIVADNKILEFSEKEWRFIKDLFEDAMKFHAAVYNEFKEFAPELTDEFYDADKTLNFKQNKELLNRLKNFGFETYGLEGVM